MIRVIQIHRAALLPIVALLVGLAAGPAGGVGQERGKQPNIVFIMADDLGWTDLGSFGSGYYETPNIDRLAQQGMRFTDAYSGGPNCAPTRACFMSGQYTPRHMVYSVGRGSRGKEAFRKMVPPRGETELDPGIVTVAETLQKAGYATGHFGKWHLGEGPDTGPFAQGFDVNVGGWQIGHPRSYFSPYRNPALEDGPRGEHLTDRLTDEAIAFLEAHATEQGERERFFLYLPFYAVHTPIQAKPELVTHYEAKPAAGGHYHAEYAAMIHAMDQNVGRVMKRLDSLGLVEETIVVFISDNGGLGGAARENIGHRGVGDITDNAPLRGGKGMLYEGGIRVPMIVRWPGQVEPGSTCDTPVTSVDFYPTFARLAEAPRPDDQSLDGIDITPLLRGQEIKARPLFWHFPGYLQQDADKGTWRATPTGVIREGDWKLLEFFETGTVKLYNLTEDIGEKNDLSAEHPEKAAQLRDRLHAWRKELNAPMPEPKGRDEPE